MTNPETVAKAITPLTKLIWIETPTNPTLKVIDIKVVCKLAKDAGIISVVDDTFATPLLQTPSDLGADITVFIITIPRLIQALNIWVDIQM